MDGHIVVRVMPGGTTYYVIILNDENETHEIWSVHGPYETKVKTNKHHNKISVLDINRILNISFEC